MKISSPPLRSVLAEKGRAALAELPTGDRLAAEGMLRAADASPKQNPNACDVTGKSGTLERSVDAREQLQKVSYALLGEVVGKNQGLSHGSPANLYTVKVNRSLRWPSDQIEPPTVHILRYDAAVTVDGHVLCSLMLNGEVAGTQPLLVNARPETLFYERGAGYASVPGDENEFDPVPWDQFVAQVTGGVAR